MAAVVAPMESISKDAPALPTSHLYADEGCPGSVRSLSARGRARIKFVNQAPVAVRVFWIDYDSVERPYGVIAPGESRLLYSFLTHAWCFASEDPELVPHHFLNVFGKPVAFPNTTEQDTVISVSPTVPWSLHTHGRHFAAQTDFCASVRALLLTHHKLRHGPLAVTPAAATSHLAAPAAAAAAPAAAATRLTVLGDLPIDVLLEIVAALAPAVPDVVPLVHKDVELPPPPSRSPSPVHLECARQTMGEIYSLDHPHTREFSFWIANKMALQAHQQLQQQQAAAAAAAAPAPQQQQAAAPPLPMVAAMAQAVVVAAPAPQAAAAAAALQLQQQQAGAPFALHRRSARRSLTHRILKSLFPTWRSSYRSP